MSEDQELEQLEASLASDPNIAAALQEHNDACADDDDSDTCVICNTKKALAHLMFVDQALEHSNECDDPECEELTELDVADGMIDSLESALRIISVCSSGIELLAKISRAAAFVIHMEELENDDDEDSDL